MMKISTISQLLIIVLSFIFIQEQIHATHNIAGRIEYQHSPLPNEELRFCFTVVIHAGSSQYSVDRDTINIDFGDGVVEEVIRTNGEGVPIFDYPPTKLNEFKVCHTYQTIGHYTISVLDPNRTSSIINIDKSGSDTFYIYSNIIIREQDFEKGFNNSPVISTNSVGVGVSDEPYVFNPCIYDTDGDELRFELVKPLAEAGVPSLGYKFPNELSTNVEPNEITLDPDTGEFIWDSPRLAGTYVIAILVNEYRGGLFMGNMVWDMQFTIYHSDGNFPVLDTYSDTCIMAGTELKLNIESSLKDEIDLTLEAFGTPFSMENSPATFEILNQEESSIEGSFSWQTNCSHILGRPYTIFIKASHETIEYTATRTTFDTWQVTLIPPAPTNVETSVLDNGIEINWNPSICDNSSKFMRYHVFRKEACDDTEFISCTDFNVLLDEGYTSLSFFPILETTYTDFSAMNGVDYSYRVVSKYADIVDELNPLGWGTSFSLPSKSSCIYTNIEEPNFQNNQPIFEIFPNPIQSYAQIRISNNHSFQNQSMILEVYDSHGKQVVSVFEKLDSENIILDTKKWKSGTYLFQLKSEGHIFQSKKIIIL